MKIAVLVSGGVDSSVALAELVLQGHECHAFYLKIWLEDELAYLGQCPWQEDLSYVQAVCAQLGVSLTVLSLQKEYWESVVASVIADVKAGYTPNPDILCNQRIKFGVFFSAIDSSFEKVATGHYAHLIHTQGTVVLHESPDPIKDQTYFLSQLSLDQLSRALFPLGLYTKPQVRALATAYNLPTKNRKDSQGICFLGSFKFRDFLKHHLKTLPGRLIEQETDKVVGMHEGFWFYTIGQRQGLGLGGGPWYVVAKDVEKNDVFISRNYYADEKKRNQLWVQQCRWFSGNQPQKDQLQVKLRHGVQKYRCTIKNNADGLFVTLDGNDQGIAAGQFAVFYDEGVCLGGGVMDVKD